MVWSWNLGVPVHNFLMRLKQFVKSKWARALKTMAVLVPFLYHINNCLQEYQERSTIITGKRMTVPLPLFPPVTICPWPSFDPLRLAQLGLNTSAKSVEELEDILEEMAGVNKHLTGKQFVEKAAWRVEDLVEGVEVGDLHESYNTNIVASSLWRRSYTPLGPCLTLTAPPLASRHSPNLTIKLRPRPKGLEPCRWVKDGRGVQYEGPEDCPSVQRHCNTSCVWQQFLAQLFYVQYIFLSSTATKISVNRFVAEFAIGGFSDFSKSSVLEQYHISRLGEDAPDYDSEVCFHTCLMKPGEDKGNCKAIYGKNLNESATSLCISQIQQFLVARNYISRNKIRSKCFHTCKPQRQDLQWKIEERVHEAGTSSRVKLELKPSQMFVKEKELYPLRSFLSDVGGSLGLFLGFSLFDLWVFIINNLIQRLETLSRIYGFHQMQLSKVIPKTGNLMRLTGVVALAMVASLHVGFFAIAFWQQPEVLSVSLASSSATGRPDADEEVFGVSDLLMGHLASRPVGCRTAALSSPHLDCVMMCIRHHRDLQFLPWVTIDDLPTCSPQNLALPRLKYMVQREFALENTRGKKVTDCSARCGHANATFAYTNNSIFYKVQEDTSVKPVQLICSFGGILGLYFGVCLMTGLSLARLPPIAEYTSKVQESVRRFCHFLSVVIVVLVCIVVCLLQLWTYFFSHPIYTTTGNRPLETRDVPAVTFCFWPPLDIRRLLETAGLGKAYDQLTHLDPEERHNAITHLLQKLPLAPNATDPQHLWSTSVMDNKDVFTGVAMTDLLADFQFYDCRNKIDSILHQCRNCVPRLPLEEGIGRFEYRTEVYSSLNISNYISTVYTILHSQEDLPVIDLDILDEANVNAVEMSGILKWENLQGSSVGRGECVSRCLDASLVDHVGCRLPWVGWRQDLRACNMTQFAKFLSDLWRLGPRPRHVYSNITGADVSVTCELKCQPKMQTFYHVSAGAKERFPSQISIEQTLRKSERLMYSFKFASAMLTTVRVLDGYCPSLLLSDLGGVVGMTLGMSLLSLFLILSVPRIVQPAF